MVDRGFSHPLSSFFWSKQRENEDLQELLRCHGGHPGAPGTCAEAWRPPRPPEAPPGRPWPPWRQPVARAQFCQGFGRFQEGLFWDDSADFANFSGAPRTAEARAGLKFYFFTVP